MTSRSARPHRPAGPHRPADPRSLGLWVALVLVALLGVAACSPGSDETDSAAGGGEAGDSSVAGDRPRSEASADELSEAFAADATSADAPLLERAPLEDRAPEQAAPGEPRSLIRTGSVALRSLEPDGVDDVLFEVRRVVAERGGEIAEERTEADDDGRAARALLTLRVPTDDFDATITELRTLTGTELVDANTTTEDVSTEVIDVDVRVDLQRRSIERISLLLERAQSIRDVVSIERELARREADLGSLVQRQEFLADQTSFATITVSVQRTQEPAPPAVSPIIREDSGFAAGLADGWRAFSSTAIGVSTATGALLPFVVLVLLLGVPILVLVRRRRTAAVDAPAASGPEPA